MADGDVLQIIDDHQEFAPPAGGGQTFFGKVNGNATVGFGSGGYSVSAVDVGEFLITLDTQLVDQVFVPLVTLNAPGMVFIENDNGQLSLHVLTRDPFNAPSSIAFNFVLFVYPL